MNLSVIVSVLKAILWLYLGALLSFFAFAELPSIKDIDIPMVPLLAIISFLKPILFLLEVLRFPTIGLYTLIAIGVVTPLTALLAYRFATIWGRVLIGFCATFVALWVFSLNFMDAFEKAVARDVERQKIDCVYLMPTFKQLFTQYFNDPTSNAHVFALKDGSKYLWSFRAMSFVDVWEENTQDRHGGCIHLLNEAPK